MNKEVSIKYVDDRLGNDKKYSLDNSKIKGLGFRINYDLLID